MRDPARIPRVLDKLQTIWSQNPDWRLGQLVSNSRGLGPQDVFYYEDSDLEAALDKIIKEGWS